MSLSPSVGSGYDPRFPKSSSGRDQASRQAWPQPPWGRPWARGPGQPPSPGWEPGSSGGLVSHGLSVDESLSDNEWPLPPQSCRFGPDTPATVWTRLCRGPRLPGLLGSAGSAHRHPVPVPLTPTRGAHHAAGGHRRSTPRTDSVALCYALRKGPPKRATRSLRRMSPGPFTKERSSSAGAAGSQASQLGPGPVRKAFRHRFASELTPQLRTEVPGISYRHRK